MKGEYDVFFVDVKIILDEEQSTSFLHFSLGKLNHLRFIFFNRNKNGHIVSAVIVCVCVCDSSDPLFNGRQINTLYLLPA